jgi:hypothetical protein
LVKEGQATQPLEIKLVIDDRLLVPFQQTLASLRELLNRCGHEKPAAPAAADPLASLLLRGLAAGPLAGASFAGPAAAEELEKQNAGTDADRELVSVIREGMNEERADIIKRKRDGGARWEDLGRMDFALIFHSARVVLIREAAVNAKTSAARLGMRLARVAAEELGDELAAEPWRFPPEYSDPAFEKATEAASE